MLGLGFGFLFLPLLSPTLLQVAGLWEAGEGSEGTLGLHPLRGCPAEAGQGTRLQAPQAHAAPASHHHIMALHLRLLVRQLVVFHFEAARAEGAGSDLAPAQPPPRPQPRGLWEPLRHFPDTLPPGGPPYPAASGGGGLGSPTRGDGVKQLETSRGRESGLIRAAGGRDPDARSRPPEPGASRLAPRTLTLGAAQGAGRLCRQQRVKAPRSERGNKRRRPGLPRRPGVGGPLGPLGVVAGAAAETPPPRQPRGGPHWPYL